VKGAGIVLTSTADSRVSSTLGADKRWQQGLRNPLANYMCWLRGAMFCLLEGDFAPKNAYRRRVSSGRGSGCRRGRALCI